MATIVGVLGSSTAFAGGGTTPAAGVSGARYSLTITCATRSATARASLATATNFSGVTLSDNAGGVSPIQYTVGGAPATTGAQDWVFAAALGSAATTYQLDEVALDGTVTPVVPAVSTTDCPTYSGVGAQFVPIATTRLLDTRAEFSIGYSGPKPGVGGLVDLQVTGRADIPTDAVAVALNVTMTEASAPGFVQVFPTGVGMAGASSNINAEAAGQTIPNQVIVPIGIRGKVTLFTNAGTHLLADVSGYFVDAGAAVEQGRFVSVAPKRVLDTRAESALNYSGAKPGVGATVRVNPVAAAGLPAGQVSAVALNVTATESTAPGYVQVAQAGTLVPGASSNLNLSRAGQTIPNMVIVPVSATGEIDLFTQTGTNLIVDVLGWFTNSTAPSAVSGLYFPVTPERVLDTRPDSAVNFAAERRPGLDETTKPARAGEVSVYFDGLRVEQVGAVILNLTATESTGAGYVQGAAQGALVPGASSNLNVERVGQTIANAVVLPVNSSRAITLFTQNGTNMVADISGFFRK
ncbi:MAG: hypothetical protein ABIR32_12180 [Ilumatobacteraceae bacterium]